MSVGKRACHSDEATVTPAGVKSWSGPYGLDAECNQFFVNLGPPPQWEPIELSAAGELIKDSVKLNHFINFLFLLLVLIIFYLSSVLCLIIMFLYECWEKAVPLR